MTTEVEQRVARVSNFLSDRKITVDKSPDYDLPDQLESRFFADSVLLTTNPEGIIGVAIEFMNSPSGGVRFEMRRQGTISQMEELSRKVDYNVHTPLAEMSHVSKVVFEEGLISISGNGGIADPGEKKVDIDLIQKIVGQNTITPLAA